jgi:peptidoglycan hydrolase CwlO-like protein
MKTLNEIAQEKYGKDYNHLPDDGAEQDCVMLAYYAQKSSLTNDFRALDSREQALKSSLAQNAGNGFETPGYSNELNEVRQRKGEIAEKIFRSRDF